MSQVDKHTVTAENYTSTYTFYEHGSFSFTRKHIWKTATKEIDVFPKCWSFAVADLKPGQVKIAAGDQSYEIEGKWAAFIPAYSIVEWELQPSLLEFEAFLSQEELPLAAPKTACLFPLQEAWPQKISDIADLIPPESERLLIGKSLKPNETALSVKHYLDQNYQRDVSIAEISKLIGISHEAMTRNFKKTFGLSPVVYRNKLRVFNSMIDMLTTHHKVYSAGLGSGFSDISRFYSQFKKHVSVNPSQFLKTE